MSPRPRKRPRTSGPGSGRWWCGRAAAASFALVVGGCASGGADLERGLPAGVREWLGSPAEDEAGVLAHDLRAEITAGFRALVEASDFGSARRAGEGLLARDPQRLAAHVLLAQADFADADCPAVRARLSPLLANLPHHRSGQLLLGRCAELAGDVVAAYTAYRGIADVHVLAERGARRVEQEAYAGVRAAVDEALAKRRLEEAEELVHQLELWRPEARETLVASRLLMMARGDTVGELSALRRLNAAAGAPRETLERQAELELDHGEARIGLEIYRQLASQHPDDAQIADRVAASTFRWRVQRLPAEVSDLARKPELTRGDCATLLYWLVPELRTATGGSGRIATDVLEHPQREAIVRMLNLGVMRTSDATLRTFSPDATVKRRDALAGLLVVAKRGGDRCLAARGFALDDTADPGTCQSAADCGLVPSVDECLPSGALSGEHLLEMVRRLQQRMEQRAEQRTGAAPQVR